MNTNSKWIVIGGLGLGVLSGIVAYFSRQAAPVVSRDNIMKALNDLKGQTFSLFITTAGVVKKIMMETGGKYELENGKNVGDLIRDEVMIQFDQKKASILIKYGIDENDFASSVTEGFSKDEEVQDLVKTIFDGLEEALKGNGPSLTVRHEIRNILTKEKTIDIVTKILILSSKSYLTILQNLKKEGHTNITIDDPKVARSIGELNMRLKKKELMKSEGVDIEPDSPTEVLGKVTQLYREEDQSFSKQLTQVQKTYITVQERLGKDITTSQQIEDEFQQGGNK